MYCCRKCKKNSYQQGWIKWSKYGVDMCIFVYKIVMKIIGPIAFLFADILIAAVATIFFFWFIPELSKGSIILYLLNMIFGLYIVGNIYFYHYVCFLTPPGSPSYCPDPGRILGEKVSIIDGRRIYQFSYQLNVAPYVSYKYCHVCKCVKPPRAHHCSVSGKCILNMDHYCPWMSTCIGYGNYRYFVMFLVYLLVGCSYVIIVLGGNFVHLSPADRSVIHISSLVYSNLFYTLSTVSASTFCFAMATAAFVSAGVLFIWHSYLIITNQTTIEFYVNMRSGYEAKSNGIVFRNPFDEGWRKNLRRVFGNVPWYRNLLPGFHPPAEPKYPFELSARQHEAFAV